MTARLSRAEAANLGIVPPKRRTTNANRKPSGERTGHESPVRNDPCEGMSTGTRAGQSASRPNPTKRNRRQASGPYHTVCVMCGSHLLSQAAEDRHLAETRHPRYGLVLHEADR